MLRRGNLGAEVLEDRACAETVDAAAAVHDALGAWHAPATYLEALTVELAHRGLRAHRSASISVLYRGRVVGSLEADLLVEDRLLILVRAERELLDIARLDVLRGLAAANVRVGLLLNFGATELNFARIR